MSEQHSQLTALVTGASSGIGYWTAKELASRNIKVFACARRLEPMKPLEELGITIIKCDVTDAQEVQHMKSTISDATGGKLNILFNNAGSSCTFPAVDVTDEAALKCFQVNVLAPIRLSREFSPLVIKAKGLIAFTGSLAGIVPFPFASVYSASKAAIHQYCQVLHLEMKMFDVKVLNLITGGVKTNIADTRPLPENSIFNTEEGRASLIARQKMSANAKPQAPEVYAKNVVNDMLKFSPRIIDVHRGSNASILPWVIRWIPRWIVEMALLKKFKLYPVWSSFREKREKKD
ncbi:acylglycerone-phosphate reductase [Saccharomycopsis crataegensis]|uniref:Acylglycerone-phosphate reductase n=1 Tax=Saccharomycopsis crataegensis TaxID=43959 RepID=A0AAV5QRN5_9ASCO|nr:acylglycerone-phosphate reductase [Saccharomycopsis crataegensis]